MVSMLWEIMAEVRCAVNLEEAVGIIGWPYFRYGRFFRYRRREALSRHD